MAFITEVWNSAGSVKTEAIYLYDDALGLIEAIARGDTYLGATITDIDFSADHVGGEEMGGFNDAGEIAFRFSLSNGTSGIGIWSLAGDGFVRGDWDRNGATTNTDIQAMLDALVDLDGYRSQHALNDAELLAIGDLDYTGQVANADIQAMLDYLTGQSGMSVHAIALEVFGDKHYLDGYTASMPEPATLGLLALGGAALLRPRTDPSLTLSPRFGRKRRPAETPRSRRNKK
jgi:hypothetical protein